jgi:small subunit ribosomal protein S16
MALKIRLAHSGARKRPFYRIVVAESSSPRDGRFIERLGHYNPMLANDSTERVVINAARAQYWLSQGAQVTERVALFFANAGLIEKKPFSVRPKKSAQRRKAQEREKMRLDAEKAAAESPEVPKLVESTEVAEPVINSVEEIVAAPTESPEQVQVEVPEVSAAPSEEVTEAAVSLSEQTEDISVEESQKSE